MTGDGSSRPLARTLHPIFRDRVDMSAGGELSAHLGSALAASEYLIVLCSPSAAESPWVDYEIQTFINLGRRGSLHLR
jgi:hypothetical protein